MISFDDAVEYEICGNSWASWIPFEWLQNLVVAYLTRKAKRKHNRYKEFYHWRKLVNQYK